MLGAAARAGTDAPAGLVALLLPARGAGEGSRNGEGREPRAAEVPRAQGAGFGKGGLWVPRKNLGKWGRRLEQLLCLWHFPVSLEVWIRGWPGQVLAAVLWSPLSTPSPLSTFLSEQLHPVGSQALVTQPFLPIPSQSPHLFLRV